MTISLYKKLPRPIMISGSATVTVGATVYPIPGSVTRIEERRVFDMSITAALLQWFLTLAQRL